MSAAPSKADTSGTHVDSQEGPLSASSGRARRYVHRDVDRVRITAQLIDAGTGVHLWSEVYDRELKDIFAIQSAQFYLLRLLF